MTSEGRRQVVTRHSSLVGFQQPPQQTGVLFIIRQQVQPDFIMVAMQSQQAWIMAEHFGSPEVQVTVQTLVGHLALAQAHGQVAAAHHHAVHHDAAAAHAAGSMVHRFCTMLAAIWSSQTQVIFMPPCTSRP